MRVCIFALQAGDLATQAALAPLMRRQLAQIVEARGEVDVVGTMRSYVAGYRGDFDEYEMVDEGSTGTAGSGGPSPLPGSLRPSVCGDEEWICDVDYRLMSRAPLNQVWPWCRARHGSVHKPSDCVCR